MFEVVAIGGLTAYFTAIILIYLIPVIAGWKMFVKAGIPGWKSLIPVYNLYLIYKMADMSGFWAIFTVIASCLGAYLSDKTDAPTVLIIISGIVGIVAFVGEVMKAFKLSKAFGKGTLFAIFMIIFPSLGEVILGFGSSKYEGKYSE